MFYVRKVLIVSQISALNIWFQWTMLLNHEYLRAHLSRATASSTGIGHIRNFHDTHVSFCTISPALRSGHVPTQDWDMTDFQNLKCVKVNHWQDWWNEWKTVFINISSVDVSTSKWLEPTLKVRANRHGPTTTCGWTLPLRISHILKKKKNIERKNIHDCIIFCVIWIFIQKEDLSSKIWNLETKTLYLIIQIIIIL